jgi:hypothetical protein
MPLSTLPSPSRSSGLSRLVVDSTTRPLYRTSNQLQTNLKPSFKPTFIAHSKFHILTTILPRIRVVRVNSRLKGFGLGILNFLIP